MTNEGEKKKWEGEGGIRYLYIYILQISFSDGPHKYKSLVKRISTGVTAMKWWVGFPQEWQGRSVYDTGATKTQQLFFWH